MAAAVLVVAYAVAQLRVAFLALFLAIFATALLRPLAEAVRGRGVPRALAALTALVAGLAVFGGVVWLLVPEFIDQLEELGGELAVGIESVRDWLVQGPLELTQEQIDEGVAAAADSVRENTQTIAGGVLSGAAILIEIVAVVLIAIVLTFFFLKDGDRIWSWMVSLFAPDRRAHVAEMGSRSWETLAGYLRGMTVVALFDSTFIGIALVIIGVPAALPIAVLTFFGAYIPIAGAIATGLIAVAVALIALGLLPALVTLAAVIAVQQIESNVLHPVVVGRAVSVHPVAILLAVTCGALIAGIIGALVAVPLTAVGTRIGEYLRERSPETEPVPEPEG